MFEIEPTILKVWVTRHSAFSIQCGGLERLKIHFTKPVYVFEKLTDRDRDMPFGNIIESEGLYKKCGWFEPDKKSYMNTLSVGQLLGYSNPISELIWSKLKEHFNNKPFDIWHELEKIGECKVEDFCIELDLKMYL